MPVKNRYCLFLGAAFSVVMAMSLGCEGTAPNNEAVMKKGLSDFNNGEYENAIEHWKKIADQGTSEVPAAKLQTIIGNAYYQLDQFDEAIKWHKRSLELDRTQYDAWCNLGVAYRSRGALEIAEMCYSNALDLNPDYAEVHGSLGSLYLFKGETQKAIEELELCCRLNDSLGTGHANLSLAYATFNRFDDAERELEKATVRGYKHGKLIRQRIDELKAAAQ